MRRSPTACPKLRSFAGVPGFQAVAGCVVWEIPKQGQAPQREPQLFLLHSWDTARIGDRGHSLENSRPNSQKSLKMGSSAGSHPLNKSISRQGCTSGFCHGSSGRVCFHITPSGGKDAHHQFPVRHRRGTPRTRTRVRLRRRDASARTGRRLRHRSYTRPPSLSAGLFR